MRSGRTRTALAALDGCWVLARRFAWLRAESRACVAGGGAAGGVAVASVDAACRSDRFAAVLASSRLAWVSCEGGQRTRTR